MSFRKMGISTVIFLFIISIGSLAWAQFPTSMTKATPPVRLITVTGEALVRVVPDQVVVTLGVETSSEDLAIAKSQNDARINKVLSLAQEMGIAEEDIQTSHLNIQPRYRNVYEQQTFIDYVVQKQIVIYLKKVEQLNQFIGSALEAKVNYVYGIEFQNTALKKHQEKARSMAIQDAKAKAQALAKDLGQEIGRPYSIQEYPVYAAPLARDVQTWGVIPGEGTIGHSAIALGRIDVRAQVGVSFELEDSLKESHITPKPASSKPMSEIPNRDLPRSFPPESERQY